MRALCKLGRCARHVAFAAQSALLFSFLSILPSSPAGVSSAAHLHRSFPPQTHPPPPARAGPPLPRLSVGAIRRPCSSPVPHPAPLVGSSAVASGVHGRRSRLCWAFSRPHASALRARRVASGESLGEPHRGLLSAHVARRVLVAPRGLATRFVQVDGFEWHCVGIRWARERRWDRVGRRGAGRVWRLGRRRRGSRSGRAVRPVSRRPGSRGAPSFPRQLVVFASLDVADVRRPVL